MGPAQSSDVSCQQVAFARTAKFQTSSRLSPFYPSRLLEYQNFIPAYVDNHMGWYDWLGFWGAQRNERKKVYRLHSFTE